MAGPYALGFVGIDLGLQALAIRPRVVRAPRLIRHREVPFELFTNEQCRRRFRFMPQTLLAICSLVEDQLRHKTQTNRALSPMLQLLTAIRFMATGSTYLSLCDMHPILSSPATVTRCIWRVIDTLVAMRSRFIKWPSLNEQADIKVGFEDIAGKAI